MDHPGIGTVHAMPRRIVVSIAAAYALAGLVYLLSKSVLSTEPEVDLKYIWVAGRLWAEGINPYSQEFSRIGDGLLADTNRLDTWLYPPNWWIISRTLAGFEIEFATFLWRSLNALLLGGGVILIVSACRPCLGSLWVPVGLALFGYASTMQATAITLSMGQTSIILYFGICALLFGLLRERMAWIVGGLVLVALKPNVGIVLWVGLAALPSQWRALGLASLVTLGLCIPSFVTSGIGPTMGGLITAYLNYDGSLEVNASPNITGLRHLAGTLLGVEMSALQLSIIAALIAWLGGVAMRRRKKFFIGSHLNRELLFWILLVMMTCVALHSYDFIIFAPLWLLVFSAAYPAYLRLIAATGLLLIYRSANIAEITGFKHADTLYLAGSRIDSLASLVMLLGFSVYLLLSGLGSVNSRQSR